MRSIVAIALAFGMLVGCQPKTQPSVVAAPADTHLAAHDDACRDDIPDCAAACALRETHRDDFIDFYERRCAAVILGKNPDKVEMLQPTPYGSAAPAGSGTASTFPPESRAPLSLQPSPTFDPATVPRTGGSEPAECRAARILRAQNRPHDADMLAALCAAKGGDAGL
jgi:hypothetical protein